jgi:hypothetical protein
MLHLFIKKRHISYIHIYTWTGTTVGFISVSPTGVQGLRLTAAAKQARSSKTHSDKSEEKVKPTSIRHNSLCMHASPRFPHLSLSLYTTTSGLSCPLPSALWGSVCFPVHSSQLHCSFFPS